MVREDQLDLVLVPLALSALAGYHLWLLYTILRHPTRTVIGINAMARKRWVTAMMAVEHGEERRIGRADAAEQHHGVNSTGHDSDHARLRHQRLHRRHVPFLLLRGAAAAGVREQGRCGVRGQVPGRVALLHAGLRVQRAGHPPVRARQLPPQWPAARRGGGRRGGVRGVRGADREPGQLRLVAWPARLLRVARAIPLDVRAHPDAGLQRAHVRLALLPRHHQRARARPWPRHHRGARAGSERQREGRQRLNRLPIFEMILVFSTIYPTK